MTSLLCPTRGRPENMKRLWESARDMADNCREIEIIFYLDNDDESSRRMAMKMSSLFIMGERIVLSEMWNRCYEKALGDILMHCGDDIVFRTKGWDSMVTKAFDQYPDKIAFVYGKDGYSPDTFGTHGFLHRNWVRTVGYFVPPYFSSDMNDTWLNDVSDALGRKVFLPDLYTEHLHPINGKADWDLTHRERLGRGEKDNVIALYESKASERAKDVKKLKQFIESYKETP